MENVRWEPSGPSRDNVRVLGSRGEKLDQETRLLVLEMRPGVNCSGGGTRQAAAHMYPRDLKGERHEEVFFKRDKNPPNNRARRDRKVCEEKDSCNQRKAVN